MADLSQAFSEVKSLPDEVLAKELKSPTGMLPGYLILGEMKERRSLRSGAGIGGIPKPKSLAEEYVGSIEPFVNMPPKPPVNPNTGVAGLPTQAAPQGIATLNNSPPAAQGYASGGIVGLAGGGHIKKQMWDFFKSKGLEDHQVAGILGHAQAESAFNPAARGDNGDALGLFQWNDRGPAMRKFVGENWAENPQGQMEFAWQEMQGPESRAFNALRQAPDVKSATAAVMGYERPSGFSWENPTGGHNWSGRLENANKNYAEFTGSAPTTLVPASGAEMMMAPAATTAGVPVLEAAPAAAGANALETMMAMEMLPKLLGTQPQAAAPSPAAMPAKAFAPPDPYELVARFSHTPGFYERRKRGL